MVSNEDVACNDLYQYGYHGFIEAGLNNILPMLIIIFLNGWAILTLIKSREALQVRSPSSSNCKLLECFQEIIFFCAAF